MYTSVHLVVSLKWGTYTPRHLFCEGYKFREWEVWGNHFHESTLVSSLQSAIRVTIAFPLIFGETNFVEVPTIHEFVALNIKVPYGSCNMTYLVSSWIPLIWGVTMYHVTCYMLHFHTSNRHFIKQATAHCLICMYNALGKERTYHVMKECAWCLTHVL